MRRQMMRLAVAVSVALTASGAPVIATAQSTGSSGGPDTVGTATTSGSRPDDADSRRSDAQERRRKLQDELGVLERSDAELDAELSRLSGEISALEASAQEAETRVAEVSDRLVELEGEIADAEVRAAEQHDLLIQRAVAAYVAPTSHVAISVILTSDLNEVGTRRVLLDLVADNDRRLLDEYIAAADELERLQEETRTAEAEVVATRDQRKADLESARAKRAERDVVREALDVRIAEVQEESDQLAEEEAQLSRLIAQREALVKAQADATTTSTTVVASTSTTQASTSTTATTTGPPGSGTPTTTTTRPPTTSPPTTQAPPPNTSLAWPTPGPVTSVFGWRWGRAHQGIDIGAPTGQTIVAAASGTAFYVGWMGGYGNLILIDHGNGLVTAYAHQSAFIVGQGASVSRGQAIGRVGSTGNSTGPHLHFEVRRNGVAVDPMPYLR